MRERWSRREWFSRMSLGPLMALRCAPHCFGADPSTAADSCSQGAPCSQNEPCRRRRRRVAPAPVIPDLSQWDDQGFYAAWLGHSTVLLKVAGQVILTDPIFSRRAGLRLGVCTVGIRRRVEPALAIEQIPRPDLILLSHAHMDHFDIPSLRKLAGPRTTIVTARNTSDLLRHGRYGRVQELGWDESARFGPLSCRSFEVNHWGARYGSDTWRGYNGYVIEAEGRRILFAGDTALTSRFRGLNDSRPFDLAIMPIGAYNPRIHLHCSPEQAWRMGNEAGAERFLPVHHQTFPLGQEPVSEPIERFYEAAGADSARIAARRIGEQVRIV